MRGPCIPTLTILLQSGTSSPSNSPVVKPDNIPRWSRLCIQQELTPAEFAANEAQAREVLACVMSDFLQEEYAASGNNESLAVRRAAAWWMAGDPEQYNSERISGYTQEVLQYYQQQQ
ncbi:MAG: hypothetical protein ACRC8Y_09530 [Chroococcales cyanobacterium]